MLTTMVLCTSSSRKRAYFDNDNTIHTLKLKYFHIIIKQPENNSFFKEFRSSLENILRCLQLLYRAITFQSLYIGTRFVIVIRIYMQKNEGQEAVTRILQIRKVFGNANLKAKTDYAEEFKANLKKLVAYLKTENNLNYVKEISKKLPDLENELRTMRATIAQQQQKQIKKPQSPQKVKPQSPQQSKPKSPPKKVIQNKNSEMNQMNGQISAAIVREKPNVQWDDVAGLEQAKKVIQEAVILPMKFPEVFIGQRTPWRGILLYGPPGTGKTFLAKACATQQKGGTFFSISASDLMSKYVGQSEKTLKALFQMARKERPSIIFIDEIDSIAGERSSEENQVSRRVKTQFLIQMQGVGNECTDVLVLGATNLPWALDPAVRRRFEKRVYIPLPDIKGRMAMIKHAIAKNAIHMSNQQIQQLAQFTDGYSGSDIANLVNDALMTPVRCIDKVQVWEEVNDHGVIKYAPFRGHIEENGKKYFKGNMQDLKNKGYTIFLQTKYEDFVTALKSSKPSVSPNDLGKYIDFTKKFGMDG